jgi:predicted aconitase
MILSTVEERMREGKYGPGIAKCMNLLVKYGEAFGADKLVEIASAHVFNAFPLDLLAELTEGAHQSETFTTLHPFMSLCDPLCWEEMGISKERASELNEEHEKRLEIYRQLGFFETYTCAPILIGNLVKKGDFISWFGSGLQVFANSIIGAKQNREGAVINMATAITGRSPCFGLFLDENRHAEVLVEVTDVDLTALTDADYGAIGYYAGGIAQERNIAISGLSTNLTLNESRYLMTPLSASGSVGICHIVGVTPEAPNLKAALGNRRPKETIRVGKDEIRRTKEIYADPASDTVDLVVLGCPHCTIQELKEVSASLEGKKVGSNQRLWIGTAHQIYDLAQTMGLSKNIESAGGTISRSCMATIPDCPIPEDVKTVATNSFKTAHYVSAISKGRIKVVIGGLQRCLKASVDGRWEGGDL